EQQHQELMVTDLKHVYASNPIPPTYRARPEDPPRDVLPLRWLGWPEGVREIGTSESGFHYDNEGPRHRVFVPAFELASRAVTAGEYLDFVRDGGYERPELWLSDGWAEARRREWTAPLYWAERDGAWWMVTLAGERPVAPAEPVCHVSFYEADAFARWRGARLPTEAEWETAIVGREDAARECSNFVEDGRFHPAPAEALPDAPSQMLGDVWEWTASPYVAYPGYRPPSGALGEYNAKFMCNQMVLRGGSCATPRSHIRATYRNFFPPSARWQFSGIRLARDLEDA
ncbi:MAG: ergothioneine biosynthesis protein EgtB, partial [Gemmatimonadetes bacterium]|nr:ergothioneine biosynthesis protein EgtB [Gemmatimonadota bacterium]